MQSVWTYGRCLLSRAVFSGSQSPYTSTSGSPSPDLDHALPPPSPPHGAVPPHCGAATSPSAAAAAARRYGLVAQHAGVANAHRVSPHAVQLHTGVYGDDACFIADSQHAHVIGVADGVGGWRQYGVDPSQFSRTLMQSMSRLVHAGRFTVREPRELMHTSYAELLDSKTPIIGSSTACVLMLDKATRRLYTANLGDSGFLLVRGGEVLHRSLEQQHYFNTPYQLSMAPPPSYWPQGPHGPHGPQPDPAVHAPPAGDVLSDSPEAADTSDFLVESGDLIVVGTDGLFDNLSDHMILQQLSKLNSSDCEEEAIQRTAHSLAKQAERLSQDPDYMSPFAHNATQHGINMKGGKPDDITVLVSLVAPYD